MNLMQMQDLIQMQRLIADHAGRIPQDGGRWQWHSDLFDAIRPHVPEHNRPMLDVLHSYARLGGALESYYGGPAHGRV